ncbi:MAG TPA: hypothetical protein VGR16_13685 [Thermomicrobiales bacterium]|nr:hypothetical protein [Thermomicrobiales bacterium]
MKRAYVATVNDHTLAEDRSYFSVRLAALSHARETKEAVHIRGHDRSETVTPSMATDEEITAVRDAAYRETNGRTVNAVGAVAAVGRVW